MPPALFLPISREKWGPPPGRRAPGALRPEAAKQPGPPEGHAGPMARPPAPPKDIGGFPVDADDVPPVSSANDDLPDEIDPDSSSSDAAAGEILTVKANGSTVSGSALEIVGRMTQNEVGHTFAPEAIKAQAVAA